MEENQVVKMQGRWRKRRIAWRTKNRLKKLNTPIIVRSIRREVVRTTNMTIAINTSMNTITSMGPTATTITINSRSMCPNNVYKCNVNSINLVREL